MSLAPQSVIAKGNSYFWTSVSRTFCTQNQLSGTSEINHTMTFKFPSILCQSDEPANDTEDYFLSPLASSKYSLILWLLCGLMLREAVMERTSHQCRLPRVLSGSGRGEEQRWFIQLIPQTPPTVSHKIFARMSQWNKVAAHPDERMWKATSKRNKLTDLKKHCSSWLSNLSSDNYP